MRARGASADCTLNNGAVSFSRCCAKSGGLIYLSLEATCFHKSGLRMSDASAVFSWEHVSRQSPVFVCMT